MQNVTPKVVHITTGHRAFDTRVFHKECKSLREAGYEVVLVVPHRHGDQMADGIQVKAAPLPRSRLERFTSAPLRIYREALRQNGDVYHFHDPELVPAALLLRLQKKCVIYDVHDDTPATFADKDYIPRLLRAPLTWLSRVLENAAAQRFSAIVAATPAIAERFAPLNEKTVIIENFAILGGSSQDGNVPWDERAASVTFVGGLSRERGMREMIQAMSLLPRSLPVRLTFAGWFLPQSLREEAILSPGWERVDELGLLEQSRVASVLKRARAGVLTFHPGANHDRAMPTKLFEYMSAGIPVIASDFPLWRRLVEQAGCGLLVDPLQPKEIASAIEYLVTHHKEAEEMGNRGRTAVERLYNWKAQQGKLLDLYTSLVGTPAPNRKDFADHPE